MMSDEPIVVADSTLKVRRLGKLSSIGFLFKKLIPVGLFFLAGVLLVVLTGLAQRSGWIRSVDGGLVASGSDSGQVFTCPMHPQIRQPMKGRCPICGMELVPASSGAADLDELAVKIEPAQRRLANIQTAKVENAPLEATIQTVGVLAIDESRQATIAAYIDGRLERLFADYTGVDIKKGDHLAVVYSPQFYAAQVEYLEARQSVGAVDGLSALRKAQETLASTTRQRLREFGMTDEQLSELERSRSAESRLTIYAPQGGTVVEKIAVEGNYIKAGEPIYRIADLSTVWLMLKLFPDDATRIRFGQRVEARLQSLAGEKLVGRVAFIDPTVDPKTRTVGVRVELLNDGRLRPGDYASAWLTFPIGPRGEVYDAELAGKWISPMHPQIVRDQPGPCPICGMEMVPTSRYGFADKPTPQPNSLYVLRSAVLLAGGYSVVYVETKPGLFEIRPVTLGPMLRDKIVIVEGLKAGESVATAGNFLIDSQMQLAGKPSLIDPLRAIAKSQERKGPLQFEQMNVRSVGGEVGTNIETLYSSYFEIQQTLAADNVPSEKSVTSLNGLAKQLAADASLPKSATELLDEIAVRSEHLHHMELAESRRNFKPISHAIVTLATQVRSEGKQTIFTHFFCPMVPGGGGDWLQSNDRLVNPYFGSQMLRCGEKVQDFPVSGKRPEDSDAHAEHRKSGH